MNVNLLLCQVGMNKSKCCLDKCDEQIQIEDDIEIVDLSMNGRVDVHIVKLSANIFDVILIDVVSAYRYTVLPCSLSRMRI